MSYSNNPHTVYNGMMSAQRNMLLSSSVAVVMIGFSNTFEQKSIMLLVKLLAFSIFAISIFIGVEAVIDFHFYLDRHAATLPDHIPVDKWYRWAYVSYIYSVILVCIAIVFFLQKILI